MIAVFGFWCTASTVCIIDDDNDPHSYIPHPGSAVPMPTENLGDCGFTSTSDIFIYDDETEAYTFTVSDDVFLITACQPSADRTDNNCIGSHSVNVLPGYFLLKHPRVHSRRNKQFFISRPVAMGHILPIYYII